MRSTAIIYDELSSLYARVGIDAGASETHGIVTGLVCGGADRDAVRDAVYLVVGTQRLPDNVVEAVSQILVELYEATVRSFNNDPFDYELVLPDDETSIGKRTDAVAGWCQGFVLGLMHNEDISLEKLDEDSAEIVRDMMAIAEVESLNEMVSDDEQTQSDEHSLTEIEQYLRVGAQLVFEELNPPLPTLH
jgi:yecA family protein